MVRAALLAAGVGLVAPAFAADAFLSFSEQHVIVDEDSAVARGPLQFARPIQASDSRLIEQRTLGNTTVRLPVDAACGYADGRQAVLCLDADFAMTPGDQLALLAYAGTPLAIHAGSGSASDVVNRVLSLRPELAANVEIHVAADPQCQGACERRITLEAKG